MNALYKLEQMASMSAKEVDKDKMLDLDKFQKRNSDITEDELLSMLEADINPYFRKSANGCVVKISFANNGVSFDESVNKIFSI